MKRRFMFIFVTMMMLSSFCLFNSTSVSAKQHTPKLSSTKISLETGSKKTLKIKKLSKNAKISWKSNNSKIVKVSKKGIVSAKKVGSTVVKATVKQNGKKYVLKCKVRVNESVTTPTVANKCPLPPTEGYKKNNLFDTYISGGVSKISYYINDVSYETSDQNRISAILSYMSMLDVEKMDNPMLSGGFKITLGLSDNHSASIGLGDTIFNLNGQYYKIKNSNISITTVIKYFLAI